MHIKDDNKMCIRIILNYSVHSRTMIKMYSFDTYIRLLNVCCLEFTFCTLGELLRRPALKLQLCRLNSVLTLSILMTGAQLQKSPGCFKVRDTESKSESGHTWWEGEGCSSPGTQDWLQSFPAHRNRRFIWKDEHCH